MDNLPRHGDMEIFEDLRHQRRLWIFQRIGWTIMALVVIGALLGVFGASGPLNRGSAEGGPLRIDYERFPHVGTGTALDVRIASARPPADRIELWISLDYLDGVRIEHVTPEPKEVRVLGTHLAYVFELRGPGHALRVKLHVTPQDRGPVRGEMRAGPGAPAVTFTQFVYP